MVFTFESLEDLHRVLDYSPWNIKGSPLFLKRWSAEDAIADLDFTKAAYWVQVHNLPLELMTVDNAENIGASLGELLELDNVDNSKPARKGFLRFRVLLNLLNPLNPGFTYNRPPKAPLWVQYMYERLSDYFYICGRIGHLSFACPVEPRPPDHGRYGDKLKASSPKTSRVVQIFQPRNQVSDALAIVQASNRLVTESTHLFNSTQPCSSSFASSFLGTKPTTLSPINSASALMEKASFVKIQPQHSTSSLLRTSIEKLNSLDLHFPHNTWPSFVSSTLGLGPSSSSMDSSNSKLESEGISSISTFLPHTSSLHSTCVVVPTNSTSTTLPNSSSGLSTFLYQPSPNLKPPRHTNNSSSKKRFHPYSNFLPVKKPRPDIQFSKKNEEDVAAHVEDGQSVSEIAGVEAWLEVPPSGFQGGLYLAWKHGVDIEPVRLDKHCISCLVYSEPVRCPWLFSGVYAPHTSQRRDVFWSVLSKLGNSFGGAWLLLGDFNSILSSSEKSGGRDFGSSSHGNFVDFVHSNALVDLGFVGNRFTWSNCRVGRENIRERLDRGLANQNWVHSFPNSLVNHFPATQSDHCPILISTDGSYRNLPKPFCFEAFWIRDQSSHSVVAQAWLAEVEGSPAFSLSRKWKSTKSALKFWNQHHFGHIQYKIKALMSDISVIQSSSHSPGNAARETILQNELQEQLLREEVLWKQKSRELWLTCTDLNTKFFHASTVCRRRYNSISSLKTAEGTILGGRENIGNYLVQHFSSLFTSNHPVFDDRFTSLVDKVVTEEENVSLCLIPDENEIFLAISDLGLNKAPGPDGMTGLFYKSYWPIVKVSVVDSVQSFFRGGFILKEFNHTNIALIPKIDNPYLVHHFRPISLTNFNYKIISKILSNRFKPLLSKIISPYQSAFLKGRSIHDNTILAHEVFHSMKQKKGNGGLMVLKLDMEKAFDSMEWEFLLKILELLGFNSTWIQWIRQCITTSSFSILLHGAPFGKFTPSRGLRQGDPLSPFLFILGAEILSRLIEREESLGLLHGIKMARRCPTISHLLFADDVIIFSKANESEARVILKCLNTYSSWSGQHINISKSAMFFSRNCSSNAKNAVKGILHLALIPSRAKYLGIPLFMHRRKKDSFIELKDRILAKISGWKARLLSQAARTTLVKSVANAIPTYLMSLFLLPKSFCASINSSIRKFWWGYPQEKKHCLSLLAWDNICKPKSLGGLGIRSMEAINNSLLARLGWKLTSNQPLIWVDSLRSKYLKHGVSFLNAPSNALSSWLWKGLLQNRKVVEQGACISISSGQNIDIWNNPWIPLMPNFKPIPNENLVGLPSYSVEDLICPIGRGWNSLLLQDLFDPITVQHILSIHLPLSPQFDKWCWVPSPSRMFSVKSAHELSISLGGRVSPLSTDAWTSLWGLKLQARLKHLLWKVAWDILPSRAKIGRFVASADPAAWLCPFCKGPPETLSHIFLECDLVRFLWRSSPWHISISDFSYMSTSEWILAILSPMAIFGITKVEVRKFQLFAALILDIVWRCRNLLIHEGVQPIPSKVFFEVSSSFNKHLSAWSEMALPSLWIPPAAGWIKGNFDVAVKGSFAVAAAVLSDEKGAIVGAATQRLNCPDALQGEALAALLTTRLAASFGCNFLSLEGDALLVVLAINNPSLFSSWIFANCISDISVVLAPFQSWNALKVSRSANFRAHALAK
ncbi:uncharacterized protein LOC132173020 [Corylus avellana]|uniref:uncharacterized protein LOC132173020 n=1 Tax=Corylus avellana TaxID=13451 RepID=UPI00286C623E|nr:uncharacterized protein LOC132173020 [Corylus avellana]